ncbi:MAG TPA: hypothetical protein DDW52_30125 [Planctomycetaceae bacterium]|nr:hypothetical protein [Planctomycetaceae bacterium]
MKTEFGLSGTQLWATMIFTRQWEHHPHEAQAIVKFLLNLRDAQESRIDSGVAPTMKSNHGLYESSFDLFDMQQENLQNLVDFIRRSLATAVSVANNQEHAPEKLDIQFVDSWYHITNGGGFHDAHVHDGCSWCGIYYLQTGDAGRGQGRAAPNGGSRFYCPFTQGGAYRDYGNKYLKAAIDAPVREGMLLIFPSYLLHSGLPYQGEQDRIVLAFNARTGLRH